MHRTLLLIAAACALAACSEKPQTATGIKSDAAPYVGTGKSFVVQGWKPGDRTSWEQQLKTRAVNGQNADYVRAQ